MWKGKGWGRAEGGGKAVATKGLCGLGPWSTYLSIASGTYKDLVSSQGHFKPCPQFLVGHRSFDEPLSAEEQRHPQGEQVRSRGDHPCLSLPAFTLCG